VGGAGRREHRPFALVLAGGGARGVAHAGVLRALLARGYAPSAIVGVSMGAIVGATYALNPDWYADLVELEFDRIPGLTGGDASNGVAARVRAVLDSGRALRHLVLRWGALAPSEGAIRTILDALTLGKRIEESPIPFAAVATDLVSGRRVVIERGSAADAIYASSALAGILPPLRRDGVVLADGAYVDVAPVDVARAMGAEVVVAVNASPRSAAQPPRTAVQALMRAMEISHHQHAHERFDEADLVLTPPYALPVSTLDFRHHRRCIAAGVRAVRAARGDLDRLLARRAAAGDERRTLERRAPSDAPIPSPAAPVQE
jgi:NTE family protein